MTLERSIISSDPDLDRLWACVNCGYDDNRNFLICYTFKRNEDTDIPKRYADSGHVVTAMINKEDAYRMSVKVHVKMTELPAFMEEKFGDIDDGTLSPSEVERAYKVILDFVNSCGIRYKIARTGLEHNSDTY